MAYTPIDKSDDYFNTILWTGDGDTASNKTGVGFKSDFTWIKKRENDVEDHALFDSVRGVSTPKLLNSNGNGAEETHGNNGYVSGFLSDGFSVATNGTSSEKWEYLNTSGDTYVAWNWLASNSTASNTDGSITSTVSANTTSGFSIVSYTGDGNTDATVGHGLGVTPKMIITKNISNATATNWTVYHASLSTNNQITLNQSDAQNLPSPLMVTTVGASTYTLGSSRREINESSDTYIAYCFADVKGYSKIGTYTGNGNADGPFVYTGFKPAFVMVKNRGAAENWIIFDNKRPGYNLTDALLKPNLANTESTTGVKFDMVSNGFKARVSDAEGNSSGGNFIYMAFAENPFVTSTGIPGTAR